MQMGVSARVVSGLLAALGGMPACAATQQLADLSLEQLRDVLVMTVSRVDEGCSRTWSASRSSPGRAPRCRAATP